ncbi:MAG: TIGR00341 family protein [Candidatus Magasanikbacteria bacterium]|jgi:uncharacterized hydrophobic protein (TIGR00271 family)|nr:TIGR00341 family protein [Candidatus Magasanikbacteria bacterium]
MALKIFSPGARLRRKTKAHLDAYASPSLAFFLLIMLSSAIATLGLIINNSSVVIGAMVVAPLITPIFGFSLSLLIFQLKQMLSTSLMLLSGTLLAIAIAALLGFLLSLLDGQPVSLTPEILAQTKPNLAFFLVALFSGIAGAYAYSKPDKLASVAGIAISVALIPPLAVCGIGIVLSEWQLVSQSLLLYGFNLAGICLGSIIVFLFLGFGKEASLSQE